jgi:hypothetical protein
VMTNREVMAVKKIAPKIRVVGKPNEPVNSQEAPDQVDLFSNSGSHPMAREV